MAAARWLRRSIRVRLANLPGSLNQLTSLVAEAGVNILRMEVVSHTGPDAWDDIELAAASKPQLDRAVEMIEGAGVDLLVLPSTWTIRDWAVEVLSSLEILAGASDATAALLEFSGTAVLLANADNGFVLMDPARPSASAAESRWLLIDQAARAFEPDEVRWATGSRGTRIVVSAMKAARDEAPESSRSDLATAVGAVIPIPLSGRRPAYLAVVGRRPPFLEPELRRLELFAQVAAPLLHVIDMSAPS